MSLLPKSGPKSLSIRTLPTLGGGGGRPLRVAISLFLALIAATKHAGTQAIPAAITGKWRVTKIIQTHSVECWSAERAKTLLGSTLTYQPHLMLWQGGQVDIAEALTRTLSRLKFREEYKIPLEELGIKAESVTEIDLQHEDADVTGATTEVPGDTILLAGPGRIVVSACGVYYAAVRVTAGRP